MKHDEAVVALGALAQGTRLAIIRLLMRQGPLGMAAGGIAERLDVAFSAMSFHLRQLMNAKLIERRRESRSLIYSVNYEKMQLLLGYLSKNCCAGTIESGPLVRLHTMRGRDGA